MILRRVKHCRMIKGGTPKGRLALPEFLVSLLLIFAAWTARGCVAGGGPLPEDRGESDSTGTVAVLFTAPDGSVPAGEVAEELIEAISQAEEQIDVAVYRLELEDVAEALVAAQARGVRVRMVTEADYMDEAAVARLQASGISVISDSDDPFMHNKFVVIDGLQVWTGSWNWAYSETYHNDNNVVILTSSRLAQNYTVEFEEMFEDRRFGEDSPENTPYPQLQIGGTLVETIFEPEGDGRTRILELLGGAQESIHFMAFSFTDNALAEMLVQQSRAGLAVQGVVEARNIGDSGADYDSLEQAGVDVLLDGNPYVMHHKVFIVDKEVVVTGSYNFTRSAAERNDENLLIIHSPEVAERYFEEFQRVYQMAEEVQ